MKEHSKRPDFVMVIGAFAEQAVREEIVATFAGALLKKMMQAWIKQALNHWNMSESHVSSFLTGQTVRTACCGP